MGKLFDFRWEKVKKKALKWKSEHGDNSKFLYIVQNEQFVKRKTQNMLLMLLMLMLKNCEQINFPKGKNQKASSDLKKMLKNEHIRRLSALKTMMIS